MNSYVSAYSWAARLSADLMKPYALPASQQLKYLAKAGNLAACFLGFSTYDDQSKRSAQLGFLAAAFDLVSDGKGYELQASREYERHVTSLVSADVAEIILTLLRKKKQGVLRSDGLERGADSLRIILRHFQEEALWVPSKINEVGELCQIVDDVLDYKSDLMNGELNCLTSRAGSDNLRRLAGWDYRSALSSSKHPGVLFHVIRTAKLRAVRLLEVESPAPELAGR